MNQVNAKKLLQIQSLLDESGHIDHPEELLEEVPKKMEEIDDLKYDIKWLHSFRKNTTLLREELDKKKEQLKALIPGLVRLFNQLDVEYYNEFQEAYLKLPFSNDTLAQTNLLKSSFKKLENQTKGILRHEIRESDLETFGEEFEKIKLFVKQLLSQTIILIRKQLFDEDGELPVQNVDEEVIQMEEEQVEEEEQIEDEEEGVPDYFFNNPTDLSCSSI